jgi:chromosome partitioning protein
MNSKGGCGKTTITTNLASYYAANGFRTALLDYDPQGSSTTWLNLRQDRPDIHGIAAFKNTDTNVTRAWQLRVPPHFERTIIDTPAGLTSTELVKQVQGVDTILIPVIPSLLDIHATADFIRDLLLIGHARSRQIRIGIIANRIKANTQALNLLNNFLQRLDIPVLGYLRDTQQYLHATEKGTGIHEISDRDAKTWENILNWLENRTQPHSNGHDSIVLSTSGARSAALITAAMAP